MTARISRLLASIGLACDYLKDVAALRDDPPSDGLFFEGDPVTPGFTAIRERARALNLQLVLDDGSVGVGDCVSVIRSGEAGRARPLIPEEHVVAVLDVVAPRLAGLEADAFRPLANAIESVEVDGRALHPGVAYGLSQAMLDAVARAQRRTMAEVLADEYGLSAPAAPVAIFGTSSWNTPDAVDRMIASRADVFPHGGFTEVAAIGASGEQLLEFVQWMSLRTRKWTDESYQPVLHVDVYGTIGKVCGERIDEICAYLARLAEAAFPFRIRVEDPIHAATEARSRDLMRRLVALVDKQGVPIEIVADEYCNTREDIARWAGERAAHMLHVKLPDLGSLTNAVESVLECRRAGLSVYVGGAMNDTEVSGRATVHLALAVGADQMMAKPGSWPDVSIALTRNEMLRTLALCASH